jgi:hypothetical protein
MSYDDGELFAHQGMRLERKKEKTANGSEPTSHTFSRLQYHKLTGVSFSSMYPGCIAESPLFREKRAWFRKYFPVFMKFITGTFDEAPLGLTF